MIVTRPNTQVLIVDDCPYNVIALQSLLEQFNMESDSSQNGIEAMTRIRSRFEQNLPMYKLVFLDFSMPECDGPETAK